MKPGGSNAKGAAFERSVCKGLSLWLSKGVRDDLFWRTAMSGGRATIGYNKGDVRAAQVGDIGAITEVGAMFTDRFVIECKHYKDLGTRALIYDKPCKIRQFWEEVAEEADNHKKLPILIARENHMPVIMCLPMGLLKPVYLQPQASLYFINRTSLNMDVYDYELVLKHVDGHSLINGSNSYNRFAFDKPR